MQAQNLWYLRKESMIESSKRSSMMTTRAEGDGDRCVVDGPKLGTSGRLIERPSVPMVHDSATLLAETCGTRDESPTSKHWPQEGSNPSLRHGPTGHRQTTATKNGLTSSTNKSHAGRVRACFGQVFGRAGTDPPEKRDQRRTEAGDAEQHLTSGSGHVAPRKRRERPDQADLWTTPTGRSRLTHECKLPMS